MPSKFAIQKQLTTVKQKLAALQYERDSYMRNAASIAFSKFTTEHQQEFDSLTKERDALKAQLDGLSKQSLDRVPEQLRKWLYGYAQGVNFGKNPEIIWWDENLQYVIVKFPGNSGYADRMTGNVYTPTRHELTRVTASGRHTWGDLKNVIMYIEGRFSKEQRIEMIARANELIAKEKDGTFK